MALFQERETRDELGLGSIRDSIADHLFPGTSTIQTRLRYMLFIPWLYRDLEKREVPEAQLRTQAREAEIRLADALKAGGESNGIIGRDARAASPAASEFGLLGRARRMGDPDFPRFP